MPLNRNRHLVSVGVATVALAVTSAASAPARSEQSSVPRLAFAGLRLSPGGPGEGALYVVNADGSEKRKVTDNAWLLTPSWSPSGQIAFFGGPFDARPEIYLVDADGSGLRNLTSEWGLDGLPVWSPDGRRIAYANPGIHVMRADGSGRRRLTKDGRSPLWSPDGRRIAFLRSHPTPTRNRCCQIRPVDVYVMNADGSGLRVVTRDALPTGLSWSPDGRKIAFVSKRAGNAELYVLNADGNGQKRLTRTSASEAAPAWSPDGREIAFVRKRRGVSEEIYVMNADGSRQQRLSRSGVQPLWSPDGQFIASTSARDGNREVYVIDADGSEERNVSQNPLGDEAWPAWAPGQR
jgi:TolB protein